MFNRRKSKLGRHEEALAATRQEQKTLLLETVDVFLPMLLERFVEGEEAIPEAKEITVYVEEYNDENFKFYTFPATYRKIITNPCESACRDILNKMTEIAKDHDISAMKFKSKWKGWVYSFRRKYP